MEGESMRIKGSNGQEFEMRIQNYEFIDSNWLEIEFYVKNEDGEWKVTDPSFSTFEAEDIYDWFQAILNKETFPNPLTFTEPNLRFHYLKEENEVITFRVYFELECRPPWAKKRNNEQDVYVELSIWKEQLFFVKEQWKKELKAFPVKP
jgi:hypothetical protein